MGKVKFSGAISEIRNKVGGVIYSRNRYGAYTRNYAFPLTSPTSYQLSQQAIFASVGVVWKTLTDSQRSAWRTVAASLKKTDIFSNQYSSTGYNFFMQLNNERVLVGQSVLSDPPVLSALPLFGGLTVVLNTGTSSFLFSLAFSNLTSNDAIVIRTTDNDSQGATFFKNMYRVIAVVSDATTMPYNAYSDFITRFSSFNNGMRIGCQIYSVNKITGLRSQPLNTFVDVPTGVMIASDFISWQAFNVNGGIYWDDGGSGTRITNDWQSANGDSLATTQSKINAVVLSGFTITVLDWDGANAQGHIKIVSTDLSLAGKHLKSVSPLNVNVSQLFVAF